MLQTHFVLISLSACFPLFHHFFCLHVFLAALFCQDSAGMCTSAVCSSHWSPLLCNQKAWFWTFVLQMAAVSVERRMPAKSPPIPLVLWGLTVSCELYRSAVVFIIQVGSFLSPVFLKITNQDYRHLFLRTHKQFRLFLLHSCADGKWRRLHIRLRAARTARPWRSQFQVRVKRSLRNQERLKLTNLGSVKNEVCIEKASRSLRVLLASICHLRLRKLT